MKLQGRYLRVATALVLAGTIATQIPQTASVVYADTYSPNDSGDFLGIPGLNAKTVIQGGALGLIGYGVFRNSQGGGISGPTQGPGQSSTSNLYEVTSRTEDLSEVKGLIDKGDLSATLRSDGPYTFFAPTNPAMSQLSPEDRQALTSGARQEPLTQYLKLHIVVGRYTIAQLKRMPDGTSLNTLAGETLVVTNSGGLKVFGVPVVENDIPASNGLIHPISAPLPRLSGDQELRPATP